MTKRMVLENSLGSLAISIKAITFKTKEKDMVRCILWMALFTKGIGREVFKQEKLS
jgi:hypothetical protein